MAKTKNGQADALDRQADALNGLVAVLNETTSALRKTSFDLFLHYSNEHDGWRVKVGTAEHDERWENAVTPQPLVYALDVVRHSLVAQEQKGLARRRRKQRRSP